MDMSWTRCSRNSDEYEQGVFRFVDYLKSKEGLNGKIRCPCRKCKSVRVKDADQVIGDLLFQGIEKCHIPLEQESPREHIENETDNIRRLVDVVTGQHNTIEEDNDNEPVLEDQDMPDLARDKYDKIFKHASEQLYPDCNKYTTLSFVIKLLHIKSLSGWSDKSFQMLLDLLGDVLPIGHRLPAKLSQCQKIRRDLGMDYTKIDVCKNDCILYWKGNASLTKCPTCKAERWKRVGKSQVSEKSLRYFPLKPRLQRLFMSEKLAKDMRWHQDRRKDDGIIRHPADSEAWKQFDQLHADFASDPRNVRLGLASDGMNPFGNMNVQHSIWPVVLIPYNLPPWVCMKQHNFILSMIIPGPGSPGNSIDVYLQPLIEELNDLWENGVSTYDASVGESFRLHAALLWTINDFPAYGNLSGWSTYGELPCPVCNKDVTSEYLKHGGKYCFMGHRRFLHPRDRKRSWKKAFNGKTENKAFNGKTENRPPIKRLTGHEVLEQLKELPPVTFGNTKEIKRRNPRYLGWRKKSILFELPYWSTNLLRHNLDVMHIEKNVSEVLLDTFMNTQDKTKDNLKARLDLKRMGIRKDLHPYKSGEQYKYPPATFVMDNNQKTLFCNFLKEVKFSDSYASNITRRVKVEDRKILGLKSHDYHVMLQQLMPIAIRDLLPENISEVIIELSSFFKELCSKTLQTEALEALEEKIVQTLCKLEMIFPPSFFVCMMHLPVHLVEEARLGGPVQYRWMYPVERYLGKLKFFMRNKARPEGSIAEGYLADECLTFCSRYLHGIETKFNRPERNDDGGQSHSETCLSVFTNNGRPLSGCRSHSLTDVELLQIHHYILHNCKEVIPFVDEHNYVKEQEAINNPIAEPNFVAWFKQRVLQEDVTTELKELALGPNREAFLYDTCRVNGYRFSTQMSQLNRKTQNYGIQVEDSDEIYYGTIQEIVEVPFHGSMWAVLFKCKWFDSGTKQGYKFKDGIESVNARRSAYADQPYVLASQATQVFYVEEIRDSKWHVVVKTQPQNYYNMSTDDQSDMEIQDDDEPCQPEMPEMNYSINNPPSSSVVDDEEAQLARHDIPHLFERMVANSAKKGKDSFQLNNIC